MSDWEIWLTIGVLCVATAATRSTFWLIGHRVSIPPRVQEILRYAPACALAAIIGPDLLVDTQGQAQLTLANPRLIAGLAALAFYLWRRNMLLTIVFGMAVFTLLRILHVFRRAEGSAYGRAAVRAQLPLATVFRDALMYNDVFSLSHY